MSAEEEESIRDKPFDYSLSRFYDALPPSEDPNAESSVYSQVRQLQERYEFLESVGTGGTKQIDRVLDHRTNTEVAMARPREDLGERAYETFLTEARLTARLKHPNIITVHDVSIDDQKCPFFTMELKVGDSLSTILKKLSQDDVDYSLRYNRDTLLGMFVRLCDAVAYAHSQKVLHLDLKPANVQVGQFGGVQLCDWGLARVMGVADDDAGDGMIKGTPGYMAPEQVQADAKSVQTDIYALGGILYAILTYQAPHRGTEEDILQSTVKGSLVPPAQAYPDRTIPESLNAVAVKAMAVNPEERYQGVEELQREVRRYLGGYATRAENAGVRRLLQLLYRRNRTLCWSIGTAVAVIVIGTGLFIDQLRLSEGRALEQKAIAELAQRKAEENFILYKEQTKESLKLAEDIRTSTVNMMDVENFMGAPAKLLMVRSHLEREIDPERRLELLNYQGVLHFVLLQFQEAEACFIQAKESPRYERCLELSRQYGALQQEHADGLPPEVVSQLLAEIPRKLENVCYLIAYYYAYHKAGSSSSPEELLPLVEVLLKILNHRSKAELQEHKLKLEHRDSGLHLSLDGGAYPRLHMPLPVPSVRSNVLRPLNLSSLDWSGSMTGDLEQLQGIFLKELDITGWQTFQPHQNYIFRHLELETAYHSIEDIETYLRRLADEVKFVYRAPEADSNE